ncbi:MAG: tetratricopeptide repeat protein, partial [Bacteroidia bacterium]
TTTVDKGEGGELDIDVGETSAPKADTDDGFSQSQNRFNWRNESLPDSIRLKAIKKSFNNLRDVDSILELAQEEWLLAKELNSLAYQSDALQRLATIYYRKGLYDKVLGYDTLRLKVMLKIGDSTGVAQCYNNLGIDYKLKGDYINAIKYYHQSLRLKEAIGDKRGVSKTLNNIGIIYRDQRDYEKAKAYYNKALSINIKIADSNAIASSYSYIGNIIFDQGTADDDTIKISSSLDMYLKSMKLLSSTNNTRGKAHILNNIGITHYELGRYKRALKYYEKSLAIKREIDDKRAIGLALNNMGNVYFELKNYKKAEELGTEALAISNQTGRIDDIQRFSFSLHRVYSELGQYQKSLKMYMLHDQMTDSIERIENTRAILKQEYLSKSFKDSVDFAKKEAIQAVELKNKEAQVSRQRIVLVFTLLGLILVIALAVSVYRAKKLVDQQHHEKEVLLQEIHHRVKNNLSVIISMLRLQLRRVKDESGQKVLEQSIGRIKTMSLIHQNLYQSDNLAYTNFKVYLQELMDQVMSSFQNVSDIEYKLEGDELKLNTETAIPLALISFEWVNNIYKHAFDDKKGNVNIRLSEIEKSYELAISDNGKGISKEEFMASKDSLGAKIIRTLAAQVEAELFIEKLKEGGTELKLVIKK